MKESKGWHNFWGGVYTENDVSDDISPLDKVFKVLRELYPKEPRILYHYVKKASANYVLETGADIFCRHTSYQNDPYEICTGCVEFVKYCHKTELLPSAHAQMMENLLRYDLESPRVKEISSIIGNTINSPTKPYVFCVTPNADSPYQWRNYTDRRSGGYCYCFDGDKLHATVRETRRKSQNQVLLLEPCFYVGQDDDTIERIFSALAEGFSQEINAIANGQYCPEAWMRLRGAILTVAPLIKQHKWAHEKEWRLIFVTGTCLKTEQYLRSGLSEFCGHPINLMTAIKISPHGDSHGLQEYLEGKLCKIANDNSIPVIERSSISKSITDYYVKTEVEPDKQYEEYVLGQSKDSEIMSQEEFLTHVMKR